MKWIEFNEKKSILMDSLSSDIEYYLVDKKLNISQIKILIFEMMIHLEQGEDKNVQKMIKEIKE